MGNKGGGKERGGAKGKHEEEGWRGSVGAVSNDMSKCEYVEKEKDHLGVVHNSYSKGYVHNR